MLKNHDIDDLVILLKVFDVDFASNEDCDKIYGLDVNNKEDAIVAINKLLLPDFSGYLPKSKKEFIDAIWYFYKDNSDFKYVCDHISFIFDSQINDIRRFMLVVVEELEKFEELERLDDSK